MKGLLKRVIGPERVRSLVAKYHFRFSGNKRKLGKGSSVVFDDSVLKNCIFEVPGKNCRIELGSGNKLEGCRFRVFGDNCVIRIGSGNRCSEMELWLEDEGSRITIGNSSRFTGAIQLAAIEGTEIIVGDDNLFSRQIQISTGDSHSILDADSGKRINPSQDIIIGNHVWIGMGVTISKGVKIPDDVIVGRGSIVTKSVTSGKVALAGVPARIVRENITWDFDRLPL